MQTDALHHALIETVIARGYAPTTDELAARFDVPRAQVTAGLRELMVQHGVLLHPGSDEVWFIHPFSNAPTGFVVRARDREWWAPCTWCALGVATLVGGTARITTAIGATGRQVTVRIENGELVDRDHVVHFPIPMAKAWDNVIFTCSMMLLFDTENDVDAWCARHGKHKGDVRPLDQVWKLAGEWYGRHADPNWRKWTVREAAEIFARHGLRGPIWDLPEQADRF